MSLLRTNIGLTQMLTYVRSTNILITQCLIMVTMVSVSHLGHGDHNQVREHSDSGRRDDERVWGVGPANMEQGDHCTKLQIES